MQFRCRKEKKSQRQRRSSYHTCFLNDTAQLQLLVIQTVLRRSVHNSMTFSGSRAVLEPKNWLQPERIDCCLPFLHLLRLFLFNRGFNNCRQLVGSVQNFTLDVVGVCRWMHDRCNRCHRIVRAAIKVSVKEKCDLRKVKKFQAY